MFLLGGTEFGEGIDSDFFISLIPYMVQRKILKRVQRRSDIPRRPVHVAILPRAAIRVEHDYSPSLLASAL
jgi:hypothetical protein